MLEIFYKKDNEDGGKMPFLFNTNFLLSNSASKMKRSCSCRHINLIH